MQETLQPSKEKSNVTQTVESRRQKRAIDVIIPYSGVCFIDNCPEFLLPIGF